MAALRKECWAIAEVLSCVFLIQWDIDQFRVSIFALCEAVLQSLGPRAFWSSSVLLRSLLSRFALESACRSLLELLR